jgi:hypothetical protein
MRRGAWIGLGVVAIALLTAVPASARKHLVASFHLKGSHGYGISVVAHRAGLPFLKRAGGHRVGKVTVIAGKGSASRSSAEAGSAYYTVPARFNKHRIRADLGPFGEIRLRVDKRSAALLPPSRAPQKRRVVTCFQSSSFVTGDFRRGFRFHGEHRYTSARTHRVHGQLERASKLRCRGHDHGVELKARSGSTRFVGLQDNDYGATILSASRRERSGRVEIVRRAYRLTSADAGEFTFDEGLTSAHVLPAGEPFTGFADFASPSSWMGSLSVSFPGESNVPLTGPGFEATLRSGKLPARAPSTPERTPSGVSAR